jgi:hypothetical protein
MKPILSAVLVVLLLAGSMSLEAQVSYSRRLRASEQSWVTSSATGVVRWLDDGWIYRGSGAVVRDSRLVYTCAHVIEDDGTMAVPGEIRFLRAWNSSYTPDSSEGVAPRSYRYFTGYSAAAARYGTASRQAYHLDFVILVGYSAFGSAQPFYPGTGGSAVSSGSWKYTGGYPATVNYTGANGYHFQHRTPFFNQPATQSHGANYSLSRVSTGPGNSGGPVWVYDNRMRRWGLAAVHVSGTRTTSGIHVLDSAAHSMGTNAIRDANQ